MALVSRGASIHPSYGSADVAPTNATFAPDFNDLDAIRIRHHNQAELAQVDALLAITPERRVVERIGLESKRATLAAALSRDLEPICEGDATLYEYGGPYDCPGCSACTKPKVTKEVTP